MLNIDKHIYDEIENGTSIPEWELSSILGEDVPTIASLNGKPILILVFSFGCPGCVGRAVPFANRMVVEYGKKINVVGIHSNFESKEFTKEQFQKAKDQFYIRFPFYKDKKNSTFSRYKAGGTPHWYLIDKNGKVVYSIFGSDPNKALMRLDFKIMELFTN